MTAELFSDLSRIFDLLIRSGADMEYIAPTARNKPYRQYYAEEAVSAFLK